ncbi:MAG: ABC transporter substrate-binding protein [Gaiellales bacterium]
MPVALWTGSLATPQGWQTARARTPLGGRARIDTAWLHGSRARRSRGSRRPLLETSGFIATLGNPGLEGARLAVEQVNADGGINGRPLELVNVNTESDETKAVTAAKRLIEQEQVLAIVGAMSSGSSFAITDTVQRAKMPVVANGASRGIVLPPDQKRWLFLLPLTDVLVQGRMLEHMKRQGITRIALLNSDVAFGTSGREQLERLAPAQGIRIVIQQTFGNADQDMTPQLTKIRSSDAEATVVWGVLAASVRRPGQVGPGGIGQARLCAGPERSRTEGREPGASVRWIARETGAA